MIIKDLYWEQMMGYLGGVDMQIGALADAAFHPPDIAASTRYGPIVELCHKQTVAIDCLWDLIQADDSAWEDLRVYLESACDDLLRTLHNYPQAPRQSRFSNMAGIRRNKEPVWQQETPTRLQTEPVP